MATSSRPRLQRGWHCVYDMHYHFVFVVKYRRALLTPEVVTELTRISREIQERHEFEIEMLGADKNHVHLLCTAHPKVAAGDIARIYKSISARELFKILVQGAAGATSATLGWGLLDQQLLLCDGRPVRRL